MTESAWSAWVIDLARWSSWKVVHFLPAWTADGSRVRTALHGDKGSPDLLLARDGIVLLRELKTDTGRVAPEQLEWLHAIGDQGAIWRPRDRDLVTATLTAPRTRQ